MVDDNYMLQRRAPPSARRTRFNQVVVPALIDAAAHVERRAGWLVSQTRAAPVRSVVLAVTVAYLASRLLRPASPRR